MTDHRELLTREQIVTRIKYELAHMGDEKMAGKMVIPFRPAAWRLILAALAASRRKP